MIVVQINVIERSFESRAYLEWHDSYVSNDGFGKPAVEEFPTETHAMYEMSTTFHEALLQEACKA